MAIKHTYVNFFSHELDEILEHMARLNEVGDGKSWMNLVPWVDADNLPETSLLVKFFSAKGPEIPQATWVPASPKDPASVGLSHSAGRNAIRQLEEMGAVVPQDWNLKQDHTKRGLIFIVPDWEEPSTILDFMIQVSSMLAGVPTDTRWVADILEQVPRSTRSKGT